MGDESGAIALSALTTEREAAHEAPHSELEPVSELGELLVELRASQRGGLELALRRRGRRRPSGPLPGLSPLAHMRAA
jgi:hypothetical protein